MVMGIFYKKKDWTLAIQEGLPDDIHKSVALALGEGILKNDFSAFENFLDDDVKWLWPSSVWNAIDGRDAVVAYWKDWVKRYTGKGAVDFEVKFCAYSSATVLSMVASGYATAYIMFYIEDDFVKVGVLVEKALALIRIDEHRSKIVESLDNLPIALKEEDIKQKSTIEPKANGIPCMRCGKLSEKLSWNHVAFGNSFLDFEGDISICPDCGKLVGYMQDKDVVLHDKNRMVPFITSEDEVLRKTCSEFQTGLYYLMPLKGSEYIASLSKKEAISMKLSAGRLGKTRRNKTSSYAAAAKFVEPVLAVLYMRNYDEYEKIKNCYIDALNNGVYEAANNLGILAYNVERFDKEKGLEYFRIAAEHQSNAGLENLVRLLWDEKRYEDIKSFLTGNKVRNEFEVEGYVFYSLLKLKVIESNLDYSDPLLVFLPEIKLDEGWYLSLKLSSDDTNYIGANSSFYAAKYPSWFEDDARETDFCIWNYIDMPKSRHAAWQLYLLMTAKAVLPYWWHGGYAKRTFIFGDSDLADIPALKDRDLSGVIEKGYTHPTVEIEETGAEFYAHVYCCYWNEWKGLVREHVVIRVHGNRVVEYKNEADFVIYSYHCGILY